MSDSIREIQAIVADVVIHNIESVTTDLLETGILDSLSLVELLFNLEQRFGIRQNIADLDLENFRSIEKIAEMVLAAQTKTGGTIQ